MAGWLGCIVIDPQRREYGMLREVSTRMGKGFKRRVMVCVELQPALKAGATVKRWYRARNLCRVGPYAVVMPRARRQGSGGILASPAAYDIFRNALGAINRDLGGAPGDDRYDGAPVMYAPPQPVVPTWAGETA